MHLAVSAVLAAGENTNPIVPNLSEFIVALLAFATLVVILGRLAYPRMNEALRQRTELIEGRIAEAERQREEAERLLERYRERLAAAEDETQRILEEARHNAERIRRELLAKAEADAGRELERARQTIRAERDQAVRELRQQVGSLAVELAGRVIGDSLDGARQLRLVDQYIDDVARRAGAGAMTSRPERDARG
jgi:F-type H+-transporting ATPase subunit b